MSRGMTRAEFDQRRREQLARGDHPGTYTCPRCDRVETSANPIVGGVSCKWCWMDPRILEPVWMTWKSEEPT